MRIIGVQAEAAVRANLGRSPIATFRPFVAVRSRYAEDELARAVERGARQYVVLGAPTCREPASPSPNHSRSPLGVIVYLTRDAAMSTLKFVASLPSGTEIVFDYAISPSALSESDRRVHDDATRVVAARGEPWLSYFAPLTLAADLRAAGFTSVRDLGPAEIQERYFEGRTDGLRVNGLARLVKAGR